MSQKREGEFYVLEDEEYNSRIDEHQKFVETMQKHEFTNIKTLKGNRFSIPFQDIWANPEQTHQVYFVYDPIVNTNYVRILRQSDQSNNEPKSISQLSSWFIIRERGELCREADEAIKENDEYIASQAILNIAITYYRHHPAAMMMFERYLKSPSVKVRLATIRAIGFQLWEECIPLLEKVIQEDSHRAVRNYAKEILRQIQQPDFDPDDLYEHPENYPNSLERVTDKAFQILPQLRDDLQVWMRERGIDVIDALDLYQYMQEVYESETVKDDSKSTESSDNLFDSDNSDNIKPDTIEDQNESSVESLELEQLQQELKNDKQKLTELRTQLKQVEERIKQARKTNIFGRKQSGENERERDKLTQEIKDVKNRIAENESSIKALEE